jgi:hypothetical protein
MNVPKALIDEQMPMKLRLKFMTIIGPDYINPEWHF